MTFVKWGQKIMITNVNLATLVKEVKEYSQAVRMTIQSLNINNKTKNLMIKVNANEIQSSIH